MLSQPSVLLYLTELSLTFQYMRCTPWLVATQRSCPCNAQVQEQGELTIRIDENIDDTLANVDSAQAQLLKYMNSISSNRWLVMKVFAVLLFFLCSSSFSSLPELSRAGLSNTLEQLSRHSSVASDSSVRQPVHGDQLPAMLGCTQECVGASKCAGEGQIIVIAAHPCYLQEGLQHL